MARASASAPNGSRVPMIYVVFVAQCMLTVCWILPESVRYSRHESYRASVALNDPHDFDNNEVRGYSTSDRLSSMVGMGAADVFGRIDLGLASMAAGGIDEDHDDRTVWDSRAKAFYRQSWTRLQELVNPDTALFWVNIDAWIYPLRDRPDLRQIYLSYYNDTKDIVKAWRDSNDTFIQYDDYGICHVVRQFEKYGSKRRHVLIAHIDENHGAFSPYIANRTKLYWQKKTQDRHGDGWARREGNCNVQQVMDYIDNPNTLGVVTTQHQSFEHPKVHSLPLGMKEGTFEEIWDHWLSNRTSATTIAEQKTQLLMINDNGWRHRKNITEQLIDRFAGYGYNITNNYCSKRFMRGVFVKGKQTCPRQQRRMYVDELIRSKFVVSLSGLGYDCYRTWEALQVMTIPILETNRRPKDGWRKSVANLPVLWVESMDDVTPELLELEYKRIISKGASGYDWRKLTRTYWFDLIQSLGDQ